MFSFFSLYSSSTRLPFSYKTGEAFRLPLQAKTLLLVQIRFQFSIQRIHCFICICCTRPQCIQAVDHTGFHSIEVRILGRKHCCIQGCFIAASVWHVFVFLASIFRSGYHKFYCCLSFFFCSVWVNRKNQSMRICPAGIVVKQLWERLCTKVQTICLFQSTCTPCSTDIKCCFSTLEELLVIVNTFCHITIIIQLISS